VERLAAEFGSATEADPDAEQKGKHR